MAKQIKNMSDLITDAQKRLDAGDKSIMNSLKNKIGKSFKDISDDILLSEADRLREYIQKHIDDYYRSYTHNDKYYTRTYGLQNALVVGTRVHRQSNKLYVGLFFDENLMESQSVVTGKVGNYKLNINDGWRIGSNVSFANTYRFGHYEGYEFIEKGIDDFLSNNPYNLGVIRLENSKSRYYGEL